MTSISNQPSIAILIDCWDTPAKNLRQMYNNIICFINDTPSIETVILSTYNAQLESDSSSAIWYTTYNNLFKKCIPGFEGEVFPNETTIPEILNYVNPNKFQIAMRHKQELTCYLSINEHIKNVYVFGSAWEVCVKGRPLGYDKLSTIPNLNILTETSCVLNFDGNTPELESPWIQINNNIYYLNK